MVLQRETMPLEAQLYLMRIAFLGLTPVNRFWLGLAESPGLPAKDWDLTLMTEHEPESGYTRTSVDRIDLKITRDVMLETPELFFTNLSEGRWRTVDIAFMATAPDRSGILLAWGYLESGPYTLNPRNSLHFPFRLSFG